MTTIFFTHPPLFALYHGVMVHYRTVAMQDGFRKRHLYALLEEHRGSHQPLDVVHKHYFRRNKALGSKDRAWITETVYHYIRWKNGYDHLALPPTEPLPSLSSLPLHIQGGAPEQLLHHLVMSYGQERAMELCAINQTRAPTTLRANLTKCSRDQLLEQLSPRFSVAPTLRSPWGIVCTEKLNFAVVPEFQQGLFEVQDEASQLGALCVQAGPKEHVLDYCAGSGGKTLAFGPLMQGQGKIYLHDIRQAALNNARDRCNRAGLQNVQFSLPKHRKSMDWVVIDVPCTGSGTYRRNPDLKWKFGMASLNALIATQRAIAAEAITYLKPGGTLVYMTCSIFPEENEHQVTFFQKEHALKCKKIFQSFPEREGADGFFAACLYL